MLKKKDSEFITQIGGEGELVATLEFRCFMRWGHLLLLVPGERESGLKTLEMYQPQRFLAKLYTLAVKAMYWMGLVGILRTIKIDIHSTSPLAPMVGKEVGILLGNPENHARKIICISRSDEEAWLVTKIGVSLDAKKSVEEEFQTLRRFAVQLDHTPELVGGGECEYYVSYSVKYVEGKSPNQRDEQALLKCLESWQARSRSPLRRMEIWEEFISSIGDLKDRSWIESIEDLAVCSAVVHGDFAPWNIKIDGNGKITVLDWEYSRSGGVAGWDFAHYLVQVTELVKKHDPEAVLGELEAWSLTEVGKGYLTGIGWENYTMEWIGTYLLFTHYILKQDRTELIRAWKLRKRSLEERQTKLEAEV